MGEITDWTLSPTLPLPSSSPWHLCLRRLCKFYVRGDYPLSRLTLSLFPSSLRRVTFTPVPSLLLTERWFPGRGPSLRTFLRCPRPNGLFCRYLLVLYFLQTGRRRSDLRPSLSGLRLSFPTVFDRLVSRVVFSFPSLHVPPYLPRISLW